MPNLTREVFDATASTYDRDRSLLIPGCDTFYRWAIDLIPPRAKNILDLGAGSGLLTTLIRNRFPNARIHLIDFSAPMLELASTRLAPAQRRLHQRRPGRRPYTHARSPLQSPLAPAGPRRRSHGAADRSLSLP